MPTDSNLTPQQRGVQTRKARKLIADVAKETQRAKRSESATRGWMTRRSRRQAT